MVRSIRVGRRPWSRSRSSWRGWPTRRAISSTPQWHSPDDDSIGDLTSGDDLAELVADILDAIRVETDHPLLSLEWELVGDRPPDGTVAGVVAELGVILPGSLGTR